MGVFQSLSVIALRQVVGGICNAAGIGAAGEAVVGVLTNHFTDHSQKLTAALQTANDRAWKALEVALGGDSFWDKCKSALAKAEDQAFREQVRAFLQVSPLQKLSAERKDRFQNALRELREARSRGSLTDGSLAPVELAKQAGSFARFDNPQAVIDAEWKIVERAADDLRESCPNLRWVLLLRSSSGRSPSLLAVAVRYYFRREVETDQELFQGLAITKLDALQESQEKGFAALTQALSQQGDRLEQMLADLSGVVIEIAKTTKEIDKTTKEIDKTTKDTHEAVQALQSEIKKLAEQYQLQNREVRPTDSMSMRNEGERQLVKQLLAKFRALPAEERDRPLLLSNLGKLELAAGDFGEAQEKFQKAAKMESDPKLQAEAHFNAYQAALQRQDWDGALASIRQAVALDSARFALLPTDYEPTRILGAGGFGVAFLCHHKFMKANLVVKTLQTDELDCNVDRVFSEAQALGQLNHPSIIRVTTCGYADASGKRPYLAMDYFDGVNLESYVDKHGPLSPEELLAVAVPVAEALQAAHARGILHRDVKPANILVRREGAGWSVKLIDFGLALRSSMIEGKPSTSGPKAQTTMGKTIAGTQHYAAPEQMGQLMGVDVGAYSDVYGFGKSCYFALLGTPEPDDDEKGVLPESWRTLLSGCTRRKVENRSKDFAAVRARLIEMREHPKPAHVAAPGSDGQTHDEKHWQDNYPAAVECARWYRDLLARFHPDVRAKFAKTVITIYVDGRVRASVRPRRDDRALVSVEKLNEGTLAGAVTQVTRAGIAFTKYSNSLCFEVNLQQLKDKKATHEWIAGQLLPVPPSHGGSNDETPADEDDETDETSEKKQWPHQIGDTVTHKGISGYKIQKLNDDGNGAYIKHPVSGVGKWASFGRLTIEQAQEGDNQESQDDPEKDVAPASHGRDRWAGELPVKQIVWEAAQAVASTKVNFAPRDVVAEVIARFPDFNKSTVTCQLISDCVNHTSRHHYPGGDDRYWWVERGKFQLYDVQKHSSMPGKPT